MRPSQILKLISSSLLILVLVIACNNTTPNPSNPTDPSNPTEPTDPTTPDVPGYDPADFVDPESFLNTQALPKVIVLYDDKRQAEFQTQATPDQKSILQTQQTEYNEVDGARINAQIIANLVGGTKGYRGEIAPVSEYKGGDAFKVARVIYLGSTYDHPIPEALANDILAGANITWLGYNLWKLNNDSMAEKLGIKYLGVEGAYTTEEAAKSFNLIDYKGYTFKKEVRPMDMLKVETTQADTDVLAWARKPSGEKTPYAIKNKNFWFVADIPMAWVYERDRYLVFADLIPQMLNVELSCAPRAIIRIEDIKPADPAEDLKRTFGAFEDLGIPFGMAVVPLWRDEGVDKTITWEENAEGLAAIKDAQAKKGQVLQHGYTHTYDGLLNPSGRSGEDWEFWDVNKNQAIPELTPDKAIERIGNGKEVLELLDLYPIGWVTPHYAADPSYYPKLKDVYWRHFERKFIGSGNTVAGQLFPYPVRDVNKRALVLPENARFISTDNTLDDILETARANKVLSCPWLGMFVHPYLMNPNYTGEDKVSVDDFKTFVGELQALGYEFQKLSDVRVNSPQDDKPVDPNPNPNPNPEPEKGFSSAAVVQHNNFCMDTFENRAFQWQCEGWNNQLYDFEPVADKENTYTLKSKASGNCLSIKEASTAEKAAAITETCKDAPEQQFILEAVDAFYQIKPSHSNLCLDIQDKALWGGANVEQHTCDATIKSQLWQFPGK